MANNVWGSPLNYGKINNNEKNDSFEPFRDCNGECCRCCNFEYTGDTEKGWCRGGLFVGRHRKGCKHFNDYIKPQIVEIEQKPEIKPKRCMLNGRIEYIEFDGENMNSIMAFTNCEVVENEVYTTASFSDYPVKKIIHRLKTNRGEIQIVKGDVIMRLGENEYIPLSKELVGGYIDEH
ncbi:MAG: hypothetical protein MJZ34_07480 [Paludibacteraceae bacterium]|nr:hypothetical protein [Paludibacteraceae bacterium]